MHWDGVKSIQSQYIWRW